MRGCAYFRLHAAVLGAVLNGKTRLSAKLALVAGGIGKAHMWMTMQSAYDLAQARAAA